MVFDFNIEKKDNHAIITIGGNLIEKGQAVPLLEKAEELINEGITKWAIDMEKLLYMNSSGLNTLIQLLTKARVAGGEAVLCNMNKKINELILITKLNTLFKVTDTKADAFKLLDV